MSSGFRVPGCETKCPRAVVMSDITPGGRICVFELPTEEVLEAVRRYRLGFSGSVLVLVREETWDGQWSLVYRLNGRAVVEAGPGKPSVRVRLGRRELTSRNIGAVIRCGRFEVPFFKRLERYLTRLAAVNGIRLVIEEGATDGLDSGR